MSAAGRARVILGRFPRYLEADGAGKLFSAVVESLATELEAESAQLGGVRRAHRLAHAREHVDLLRLAALHGLAEQDFDVLALRLAAARALAATRAPGDLLTYLGLPDHVFPPSPAGATAQALAELGAYDSELDLLRGHIRAIIALHRAGNGTVGALLGGAAANLELEVEAIRHLPGGYWHVARCRDLLRLIRREPPGTLPAQTRPLPALDLIGLEENPFVDKDVAPVARHHTDRFNVLRLGFEPVFTTVTVVGVEDRTVRPMVVNIDEGYGLCYRGPVPDGRELRFQTDGAVLLDGADANALAWAFRGAVFAGDHRHARDFVFAGGPAATDRDGVFAVTEPVTDAFDPSAVWPHVGAPLAPTSLTVGETRFAFFVQEAHFGGVDGGADVFAAPMPLAGEFSGEVAPSVFDGSVFAAPPDPAPLAGKVGFEWSEREPFAVRVWIPERFAVLDASEQTEVRERVRLGLDRHRAAGVHVYVDYATDLWTLGSGALADLLDDISAEGLIVNGTRLWPDGTEQPT